MFKLKEIVRQRERRDFAEILNCLRERKHTKQDIIKHKQRFIQSSDRNYPLDAPHLLTTNANVNEFNEGAHRGLSGILSKYTIKAHDSVIGALSHELRDQVLKEVQ